MTFLRTMTVCFVCLGLSANCYADSLLITYSDGTTQKVLLDKAKSAISTFQYLSSETSPADAANITNQDAGLRPIESKPDSAPKPEPKSKYKFKWAEPMTGQ